MEQASLSQCDSLRETHAAKVTEGFTHFNPFAHSRVRRKMLAEPDLGSGDLFLFRWGSGSMLVHEVNYARDDVGTEA